ncbi:MAG: glycoside hydrolase family 38 C-terminal domain-containing protein [Phycisphaerae bacterium]|nr:glycoside hydrolase family 38 C-terminal domain-containing protein [Phycisphaerae bacterium]
MAKPRKQVAYVVPHTHWDREWRYPLWTNRALLIQFMDGLLEMLEKEPGYKCFVLDGQVVAVEDYLAVRPENEARVRRAVADGRLVIGPWYTLPDQFPVDGECLVRNLLWGIRAAEGLGRCLRIGYTTFGWGQTAQLPQIYAGFGVDFIIAGKRVSEARAPHCEFLWEAPDGTRLLATRLGEMARANVYFHTYLPVRFGVDCQGPEYRFVWEQGGLVLHAAGPDRGHEDHFKIADAPGYHPEWIEPGFRRAWDAMRETLMPGCRLLMDGSDFTDAQPILGRMIADANAAIPDIKFVHGTLEEYAEALRKGLRGKRLTVVRGEMRDGPASACSANGLATRIYLKLENRRAQNLLLRWAEPLASLLAMAGAEYPRTMLRTAWKYLLLAHPHDSINGVTQDKTADDTLYRLRQAQEIGQAVGDGAVGELVKRLDLARFEAKDVLLVAVNARPRAAGGVVKLCVDTPRDQAVWDFRLVDADGNAFDVQPLSRCEVTAPVNDLAARPWPFDFDRHVVYADLGRLPAGGYKVFRVEPTLRFNRLGEWWPTMRTSRGKEIRREPNVLENEHLRASVEADGTLTLLDKATGRTYRGLNAFEDAGDAGDYWAYYPPYEEQTHTSRGCPVRIWCEENGALSATLAVEVTMHLPASGSRTIAGVRGESRRSAETRDLVITSRLTLRRGARRLDIRTDVENTIEDHRLRALFPTDLAATHSCASGHFTVDERPVDPVRNPDGTFWPEMQTHPQQHFVDVSDGRRGLAILNAGLTEYEVLRDGRATVALTLFRSVSNRICTEFRATGDFPMQKGGQCLRRMEFAYALCPHKSDWVQGGVFDEADAFGAPPGLYQVSPQARGTMPLKASLFSVEPANLILSALKCAEDRGTFILRLFNPTAKALDGRVTLTAGVKRAFLVTLDEVRQGPVRVEGGRTVRLKVPRGRIVTLEVEPAAAPKPKRLTRGGAGGGPRRGGRRRPRRR